jgi:SAM-dependent methyltransferase
MTVEQPPLAAMGANAAGVESRILVASELLCESVDLRAGERVLDVACGSGNAALAAARRFCRVVAVDDRPDLLDRARLRGEAEGLEISFLDGEAADLPVPEGSLDVVLSGGGGISVLAETDAERSAAELLRVCRPGGRIGMIAWTPDGYVGELLAVIAGLLPRPLGLPVPWGNVGRLRSLFGSEVAIAAPRRSLLWRFRSAEHHAEALAAVHAPTVEAPRTLGPDRSGALRAAMVDLARRYDVSDDDTLVLRLDYLEVVIRKPGWL